jgi:DNA polymerase-3 subunit epsilon
VQKVFEELTQAFRRGGGEISYEAYDRIVHRHATLFEDSETIYYLLQASGYPIEESLRGFRLKTMFTPWQKQEYCIVDIETNGSKPGRSQVIEIGAVMLKEGEIVDRLETFVACAYLPEHIIKLTGIEPKDLAEAPSRKEALTLLRNFMGDAVFTAHNAGFDYSFLNASFQRFGLGPIGNPVLCTIDLARRTFESERYGLAYLNESLDLGMQAHHRAYNDALATSKVLLKSFENIPEYVKTTDELIRFSKSSKKERSGKEKKEGKKKHEKNGKS